MKYLLLFLAAAANLATIVSFFKQQFTPEKLEKIRQFFLQVLHHIWNAIVIAVASILVGLIFVLFMFVFFVLWLFNAF